MSQDNSNSPHDPISITITTRVHTGRHGTLLTGTDRMYGVARVMSDFLDQCEREGIPITPDVCAAAQHVALEWLIAQGAVIPHAEKAPADERRRAANE